MPWCPHLLFADHWKVRKNHQNRILQHVLTYFSVLAHLKVFFWPHSPTSDGFWHTKFSQRHDSNYNTLYLGILYIAWLVHCCARLRKQLVKFNEEGNVNVYFLPAEYGVLVVEVSCRSVRNKTAIKSTQTAITQSQQQTQNSHILKLHTQMYVHKNVFLSCYMNNIEIITKNECLSWRIFQKNWVEKMEKKIKNWITNS